jgi:hypothetical protein
MAALQEQNAIPGFPRALRASDAAFGSSLLIKDIREENERASLACCCSAPGQVVNTGYLRPSCRRSSSMELQFQECQGAYRRTRLPGSFAFENAPVLRRSQLSALAVNSSTSPFDGGHTAFFASCPAFLGTSVRLFSCSLPDFNDPQRSLPPNVCGDARSGSSCCRRLLRLPSEMPPDFR